jgi:hypothetical protein
MAVTFSTLRLGCIVVVWIAIHAGNVVSADEQTITPIQTTARDSSERVDPSISNRLSLTERERLYDKVVRDARQLEMQGAQLRRLSVLLRPAVVHIDSRKSNSRGRVSGD